MYNMSNPRTNHTATEIQAMVRTMDQSKTRHRHLKSRDPDQYLALLRKENETLVEFYPAVFALHADDKLDETFFYMLQEKRRMEKGQTTEDDASVRVGQKLFQRWVAPIISNTPAPNTMTYEEYYRSLQSQSDRAPDS
jgi:O6-methylguanine-DNA--protein-cysteine methyltransferase